VPAIIGTAQAIDDAVATASHDGSARLWEVQYPTAAPAVLRGHEDGVTAVAFSADGRWLATASSDSSARLWAVSADLLIEKACRVAGRNLTLEEWQRYFPGEPYRRTCPAPPAHPSALSAAAAEMP
jgi:WD40 repeat protein